MSGSREQDPLDPENDIFWDPELMKRPLPPPPPPPEEHYRLKPVNPAPHIARDTEGTSNQFVLLIMKNWNAFNFKGEFYSNVWFMWLSHPLFAALTLGLIIVQGSVFCSKLSLTSCGAAIIFMDPYAANQHLWNMPYEEFLELKKTKTIVKNVDN